MSVVAAFALGFFLVQGGGVIVSETMTRAERAMRLGLGEIARRIDVEANICSFDSGRAD
jgi:hypothetical protein